MASDKNRIWPNQPTAPEVVASRHEETAFIRGQEVADGVWLRFEHGKVPELTARTAGRIALDAIDFAKLKRDIDRASHEQEKPGEALRQAAANNRGLRGVVSERDNFTLDIRPTRTIEWDKDRLSEDFGPNYTALVHERLSADISLPLGIETDEGPLTPDLAVAAIRRGLATLGIRRDEAEKLIRSDVKLEVDEKELAKMLESGQVTLSPEAATVTEGFSIVVSPLNKNQIS